VDIRVTAGVGAAGSSSFSLGGFRFSRGQPVTRRPFIIWTGNCGKLHPHYGFGMRSRAGMTPSDPFDQKTPQLGTALPARFLDAWNQPSQGQVSEANSTDAELAIKAAGTSAQAAAVTMLNRKLPRRLRFDLLRLGRHAGLTNPWKKTLWTP